MATAYAQDLTFDPDRGVVRNPSKIHDSGQWGMTVSSNASYVRKKTDVDFFYVGAMTPKNFMLFLSERLYSAYIEVKKSITTEEMVSASIYRTYIKKNNTMKPVGDNYKIRLHLKNINVDIFIRGGKYACYINEKLVEGSLAFAVRNEK